MGLTTDAYRCKVLILAEWVRSSFRPGQVVKSQEKLAEATRIMRRCDKNGNGVIDVDEFIAYYEEICETMIRWHFHRSPRNTLRIRPHQGEGGSKQEIDYVS